MDYTWAKNEVEKYLHLIERVPTGRVDKSGRNLTEQRGSPSEVARQRRVVLLIFERVFGRPPDPDESRAYLWDICQVLITEIDRGDEIDEKLRWSSPTIAAEDLHSWVWDAARPHWSSNNHAAAVWAAALNVNSRLQRKLGRRDKGESKLLQEAFSAAPASEDSPRLRLCDHSNEELFKNRHSGAIDLGKGLYAAIRNPLNHVAPDELDLGEQDALEYLAAFSVLCRWIDSADVVTHEEHSPSGYKAD
jgi:hypothetical protein